jgi:hypothetical protein
MTRRARRIIGGVAAAAAIGGGAFAGIAATAGGDDDRPLEGTARDRAVAAALGHVGGGVVLETEAGDDGAAYGVEIRRPDGAVVEVALDGAFRVTGEARDDDGRGAGD